ncbi:MAG TPA: hypothetical protein VLW08_00820, partial [Casimicrobiaceae bacterium]|nr:hypothetical protein [Casimicrobiaceae bacterium]
MRLEPLAQAADVDADDRIDLRVVGGGIAPEDVQRDRRLAQRGLVAGQALGNEVVQQALVAGRAAKGVARREALDFLLDQSSGRDGQRDHARNLADLHAGREMAMVTAGRRVGWLWRVAADRVRRGL